MWTRTDFHQSETLALSTTTCQNFYPVCPRGAFPWNFNPRPRRVARIIRERYIDQSMLAPTESRTILLSGECERLENANRTVLTLSTCVVCVRHVFSVSTFRWREIKRIWHYADFTKAPTKAATCGITTCPPPKSVNRLERAIVDTKVKNFLS